MRSALAGRDWPFPSTFRKTCAESLASGSLLQVISVYRLMPFFVLFLTLMEIVWVPGYVMTGEAISMINGVGATVSSEPALCPIIQNMKTNAAIGKQLRRKYV
jgi:hypothetical protein